MKKKINIVIAIIVVLAAIYLVSSFITKTIAKNSIDAYISQQGIKQEDILKDIGIGSRTKTQEYERTIILKNTPECELRYSFSAPDIIVAVYPKKDKKFYKGVNYSTMWSLDSENNKEDEKYSEGTLDSNGEFLRDFEKILK
ncbi:DUF3139 domain-containing protein [Lagierella sp.]|uniref:DUF3139 domain-containing protein n=1 Tax=Lagierella sp. TaxID=2849657 RepID=UPI002634B8D4|nr:DUF3139 domain-containing protein [Lagierella sp.]